MDVSDYCDHMEKKQSKEESMAEFQRMVANGQASPLTLKERALSP